MRKRFCLINLDELINTLIDLASQGDELGRRAADIRDLYDNEDEAQELEYDRDRIYDAVCNITSCVIKEDDDLLSLIDAIHESADDEEARELFNQDVPDIILDRSEMN